MIAGDGSASGGKWRGVAPGANLVSVKVAGADGATDVSVVIAAIQWVVSHREQYGIRVLNLSFGTDSIQPYAVDPLDAAVERAWFAGITVVVSAGNRGPGPGTIAKPGDDPYVITVGAADVKQTPSDRTTTWPRSRAAARPRTGSTSRTSWRPGRRSSPRATRAGRSTSCIPTRSSTSTTSRAPARRRPARSSPASPR